MITLHHGSMDNWFVLGDRDGRRINGADIEGSREEWEAVADAIDHQESISFKRCAAIQRADGQVELFSPRNSIRPTVISAGQARQLMHTIRGVLAETPVDVPQSFDDDEAPQP